MENVPQVKVGLLAVSRDCFPREISESRRKRVSRECIRLGLPVVECETLIERESDIAAAERELREKGVNALVIYLGNFGPEGPLSLMAQKFDGPVMLCAAAEEKTGETGRGAGGCLLRAAQCRVQCGPAWLESPYPGMPGRYPFRNRRADRGFYPGGAGGTRSEKTQNLLLRPPSPGFPGLQRPDQAAV